MRKLKVLDLFSGIGGFSLGLEHTGGFETAAFCEIDPYCQAVLRKHWPGVPIFDDVRAFDATGVERIDLVCGGFPCQDVSSAGPKTGIDGPRSGLWSEFRRILGKIRPRYAIVENTPGLLVRGMGRVLGELATFGFDALWQSIPAFIVGAAHRRDRVWIVANARELGCRHGQNSNGQDSEARLSHINRIMAQEIQRLREQQSDADAVACFGARIPDRPEDRAAFIRAALCREVHGLPGDLDRLKALGNAVVPQIPEIIGQAILAAEAERE